MVRERADTQSVRSERRQHNRTNARAKLLHFFVDVFCVHQASIQRANVGALDHTSPSFPGSPAAFAVLVAPRSPFFEG